MASLLRAQNSLSFSSLDSLFKYAEQHSYLIKTGDQQSLLAKWTKVSSLFNTINIKSPFTASWTDNTKLPVSYLPAEAFGGPAGTFKQVSIGQQFVTMYAITPQIDIINPAAWARIKSAESNKQLTRVNNQLNKKNLLESIAATYYNIISLQYQSTQLENHLVASDSLLIISANKFSQGVVREQDMNNMKINKLVIQDKLQQMKLLLAQNYNTLMILCDIKQGTSIVLTEQLENATTEGSKAAGSSLVMKQSQLQMAFLKSEYNANRLQAFAPTLSLIFNHAWQENSNRNFFDANANKFTSQFIGVRLTVPFPLDPSRLAQNYTSRINYNISAINSTHAELQTNLSNTNLDLDQQKAYSSFVTAKEISDLKDANYQKSVNQFNAGILAADLLLNHFSEKVNANLNMANAKASLKFTQIKIHLNNSIQ